MEDDDLKLLTTPIAKGKSLVRKLRKEMSRETRRSRPYMSPAGDQRAVPYTLAVDEPLAAGAGVGPAGFGDAARSEAAGRRRSRRGIGRGVQGENSVELAELRRPIHTLPSAPGGAQFAAHGKRPGYGAVQFETSYGRDTISAVQRSGVADQWRSDTRPSTRDSSRFVRWSDQDKKSPNNVVHDDNAGNSGPLANADRESSLVDRQRAVLNRQRPDNPWTIYRNRDTYFVYGTSLRANNPPRERPGCCDWWHEMWAPYGGFRRITSSWIFASLSLLFIANIIFLIAFMTNYWGVLHVIHDPGSPASLDGVPDHRVTAPANSASNVSYAEWIWKIWNGVPDTAPASATLQKQVPSEAETPVDYFPEEDKHVVNRMGRQEGTTEYWKFGLWQCCRNTDGLCLGPRFEAFYMATRTLCVLSLFFMALSFAWMLGHTLEKLLDYDICTMSCLISMCYVTSIFTTIAVICFGTRWPKDFQNEYGGTDPQLAFSFYLAAISIPLTLGAAVCSTMDLKTGLEQIRANDKFYSDPDNFADQGMADIPRDNISRPKAQKKKRTGYVQSPPYLTTSEA